MNLIDEDTQYFLAGSVKSSERELEGGLQGIDPCWLGASHADKESWLWLGQQTVGLDAASTSLRCFVIPNLSRNESSMRLPSVTGPPHLEFYAAAPITTKLGINIGAFSVVDTCLRHDLSEDEQNLLVKMAGSCMSQLEMVREAALRQRGIRMSQAFSSFIVSGESSSQMIREPPSFFNPARKRSLHEEKARGTSGFHSKSEAVLESELDRDVTVPSLSQPKGVELGDSSADTSGAGLLDKLAAEKRQSEIPCTQAETQDSQSDDQGETIYRKTFRRAAEYLQVALDVDGVLFADGLIGFHGNLQPTAEPEVELERELVQRRKEKPAQNGDITGNSVTRSDGANIMSVDSRVSAPGLQRGNSESLTSLGIRTYVSSVYEKTIWTSRPAEIIGLSTVASRVSPRQEQLTESTMGLYSLDSGFLQQLMRNYPGGVVWYFDKEARPFRFDEEILVSDDDGSARQLLSTFPGVRQLIFSPLTDPVSRKRLSACFAWTTKVLPVLTYAEDFDPFKAFLHTVEAEISRIETVAIVKQKESFVSSISHELRSPLHGILGAVDFLRDTNLDSFQQGLADTIRSCGSTLHDTLSSVLSYAKINELERRQNQISQRSQCESLWSLEDKDTRSNGDLHRMYIDTNIASLCEEVVEVVEGGHSYNASASNFFQAGNEEITAPQHRQASGSFSTSKPLSGQASPKSATDDSLTLTLDIAYYENWTYVTEPGALRRIMINIVGNALKYSTKGFVKVSLAVEDVGEGKQRARVGNPPDKLIIFAVTDSGKGMSRDFLENHLFMPFSQEDAVESAGVGLGMSIVKSLVTVLGGRIDVKSQLGKGTEVKVSLPMMSSNSGRQEGSPIASKLEQDILTLQRKKLNVAIHGFVPILEQSLQTYLVGWFGCTMTSLDKDENSALDILLVGETESETFKEVFRQLSENRKPLAVLIISVSSARWTRSREFSLDPKILERIPQPFGPNKISQALLKCTQKLEAWVAKERQERDRNPDELNITDHHVYPSNEQISELSAGDIAIFGNEERTEEVPNTDAAHFDKTSKNQSATFALDSIQDSTAAISNTAQTASNSLLATQEHDLKPSSSSDSQDRKPTPSPSTPSLTAARPSPRLLLVEDNTINLKLLQTFIKKRGYEDVETAENGLAAVQAVEQRAGQFDIIFMGMSEPLPYPIFKSGAPLVLGRLSNNEQIFTHMPSHILDRHLDASNERLRSHAQDPRARESTTRIIALLAHKSLISRNRPPETGSSHSAHGPSQRP